MPRQKARIRRSWALAAAPRATRVATVLHLVPCLAGSKPPRPPKPAAVACAVPAKGTGLGGGALAAAAAAVVVHLRARLGSLRPPAAGCRGGGRRNR